jgi:tight adherence protein B
MMVIGLICLFCVFILLGIKFYARLSEQAARAQKKRLTTLHTDLRKQFLMVTPQTIQKKLTSLWLGCALLSLLCQSVIPALLGGLSYLYIPFVWVKWVQHRRHQQFQTQLLQFFPFVTSVLKSGHTVEKAMEQTCRTMSNPIAQEMDMVRKEMNLGQSFEDALKNLNLRMPDHNLGMAISAIEISRKMGSNLAEALAHISETVHEKARLKQELKALTAQGKMQAVVACSMPFLLVLALRYISPGYMTPLTQSSIGKIALVYCAVSMTIGIGWIIKIANTKLLD